MVTSFSNVFDVAGYSAVTLKAVLLLFLYLIGQVEFLQLLADVHLLYFDRGQPPHPIFYG